MPFVRARPRASGLLVVSCSVGYGLVACSAAEPGSNRRAVDGGISESPASAGEGRVDSYEGPNFYESETSMGESVPSVAPMLDMVPGFYGLASGDDPSSACGAAVERERLGEGPTEPGLVCPPVTRDLISEFTFSSGANPKGVTLGVEASFAGGTFFYPDDMGGLTSDVTGDDWHLSGTVKEVSGFGLYLSGCRQIDASEYSGIVFNLWGRLASGGSLVFFVGTAAQQVSDVWLNENKASPTDADEPPNLGRCIPAVSRYDGTCREPRLTLPVTETPTQVRVSWQDLVGGCPQASVNPSEITAIAWYFPQAPAGAYSVDVHIDDLRFTNVVGPR
jgi:hypothetical protein